MEIKSSLLTALLISGILAGCGETPCAEAELRIRLVNMSDAESDTLIMRRLQKNSMVVIDSFNFFNAIRFTRFGDTLIPEAYPYNLIMKSKYDYQLYFPGAARQFHITNITEQISSHKKSGFADKTGCINPVNGCRVDGTDVSVIQFPNTIYLKK